MNHLVITESFFIAGLSAVGRTTSLLVAIDGAAHSAVLSTVIKKTSYIFLGKVVVIS
jgi:hypothetical protein